MKVTTLMASIFTGLSLVACSSDANGEDSNNENEESIIGSWRYTALFYADRPQELDQCETKNTLFFNADGTLTSNLYDVSEEDGNECEPDPDNGEVMAEWAINADGLIKLTDEDTEIELMGYSIEGNELKLWEDGYEPENRVTYVYMRE